MAKKAKESENLEKEEKKDQKTVPEAEQSQDAEAAAEPDETEMLKTQLAELNDKLLRQMAEFDNFKKRTQREKLEIFNDATMKCVGGMLGILDAFERGLDCTCTDPEFKKGVEMIFHQFTDYLDKLGVKEIEAQGQPFNPDFHNAVNQVEDENYGENTVCQVFQKGYQMGDKVIRHAMVVVANP